MNSNQTAFDLSTTFIHLPDGPAATPVPVDAEFWARIGERTELHEGRLITLSEHKRDWPNWEMHPAGDEVLSMITGELELVLDDGGVQRMVALRAGTTFIVPRGTWHTASVRTPGTLLGITRGAGTQHRKR